MQGEIKMIRKLLGVTFAFVLLAAFSSPNLYAKEDTAQITLRKTAISKENTYVYIVKKGDILSTIVRHIPGIRDEDLADNYRLIQELNPDIEDVNKLRVGQKLILPGRPTDQGAQELTLPTLEMQRRAEAPQIPRASATSTYVIKSGDTLYRIVVRELKETADVKGSMNLIKSMNPQIKDINRIYAGDALKLPAKDYIAVAGRKTFPDDEDKLIEKSMDRQETEEAKEKISMPPEARLAVIKQVLSQMNASVTSTGNYYLPIPKTGQITIDCAKMPVIEFDNGTTMFLDLENRAPDNLKKIISDNWTNFILVKVDPKDDVIVVLRKIFGSLKNYTMIRQNKPLTIGSGLTAEFFVDWLISRTDGMQSPPLSQGLRILYDDGPLFPKSLKNYARRNGLIITEISAANGIVGKPEEIYSLPPMITYPTNSAKDFAYALLTNCGVNAEKDVDVKIFDTARDGINLSIKTDIVAKQGDVTYVIYSRELSAQFVEALTQAGNKLIYIRDGENPKKIMETVLSNLNIAFVPGYFSFSGPDMKQAPFTLGFNGTKIKTDKDIFLIDFNIDQEMRGLLQEVWAANIAVY